MPKVELTKLERRALELHVKVAKQAEATILPEIERLRKELQKADAGLRSCVEEIAEAHDAKLEAGEEWVADALPDKTGLAAIRWGEAITDEDRKARTEKAPLRLPIPRGK